MFFKKKSASAANYKPARSQAEPVAQKDNSFPQNTGRPATYTRQLACGEMKQRHMEPRVAAMMPPVRLNAAGRGCDTLRTVTPITATNRQP
jgi:hypothetical protein